MKSFFTRLGSLLLCGVAVAMVGCTDFSEDIQAGDNALKDQIAGLTQSTNASVSEINSAIDALEKASQELAAEDQKLAQDLAAAKQALENTIASNKTSLESSISALNTALTNLENAHNSDKTALQNAINEAKSELQGKIDAATNAATEALTNLNTALEAIDQAKVDKTDFNAVASDVESLKMGYMQTIQEFQNIAAALEGKADLADFEKTQADLDLVEDAVESLKMGYMQTVENLTNINSTLATLGDDMDEAQSDIAALKTETAQLNMAIVNLNGAVDAITSRVDVLEEQVATLIQGYQETVAALLQIRADIDANAGKIEDNASAIKALQEAHMLLSNELTNFEYAYLADLEALETYKMSVSKQFSDLQAQDAQLANSIIDYYNQSIAAVDSAIEALTADYTAAIAALETKITTEWEKERALIYNTIEDIKKTLFAAIDESSAAVTAAYELADAAIYKTIASYVEILEIAIAEGDTALQEAMDAAVALIYKTIASVQEQLQIEIAEGDAAAIEAMTEKLEDELALVYNTILNIQAELKVEIAEGDANVTAAFEEAIALVYKTIGSTKEEIQAEIAQTKIDLVDIIDEHVALIYKTIENTKKELQSEIADLRNEFTTITDVLAGDIAKIKTDIEAINAAIAGLEEAKTAMEAAIEELQAQDSQLANSIISYYEQSIAAVESAAAELQAQIDANAEAIEANAEAVANAMIKIGEVETALETAIDELTAQDAQLAGSILSYYEQAIAATEDVANNLETAIGRIDELEDALEALKNLGMEKLEALQNADAALAAKIEEKTTEVMNMLLTVVVAAEDRANDKIAQLRTLVNDAHSFIEELRGEISDLAKRVQSLVYVPEYSDGKANVHYGATINLNADVLRLADVAFVPAKTTLRYKVNSTSATIVDEIVEAYKANPAILSYDVEGVAVRGASAGQATLEVVGVSKDKDGYLAVDVLAKNFDKSFYLSAIKGTGKSSSVLENIWNALFGDNSTSTLEKLIVLAENVSTVQGYSAALVLADDATVNNVASEFTNLVADKTYDVLQLAARYTVGNTEKILTSLKSIPAIKYPWANENHYIASSDTQTEIFTTANEPVIQLSKNGKVETYTPAALYEKYGYKVDVVPSRHVVSYDSNNKLDAKDATDKWADNVCAYNTDKFIVNDANAIGSSRSVKLVAYGDTKEDKEKYDARVNSYLEVVDVYHLNGQSVAVADKITIKNNIVKITFDNIHYDWSLELAKTLSPDRSAAYASKLYKRAYHDNIYFLDKSLFTNETIKVQLNDGPAPSTVKMSFNSVLEPESDERGSAQIDLEGYEFPAFDANNPGKVNRYTLTYTADINSTTTAVITATVTLGQKAAPVTVKSSADLKLVAGQTYFEGNDDLIAQAYAKFVENGDVAKFPATAPVNTYLYNELVYANNEVVNTPDVAENINFLVNDNVDNTMLRLTMDQYNDMKKAEKTSFTFKRTVNTWFGVPFNFEVEVTPYLPEIALIRSTEYAYAWDKNVGKGIDYDYYVNLQAYVDEYGHYTVKSSDLAYYLNVTGDVNNTQAVTFRVLDEAKSTINDNTVGVEPIPAKENPELGCDINAYLAKKEAILTWNDPTTQIRVEATLWAGAYPIDKAILLLNVADPLTLTIPEVVTVTRNIMTPTTVKVFKNFKLTSSAINHLGKPYHEANENLINTDIDVVDDINEILVEKAKVAYGAQIKITKIRMYEVTANGGEVIYDNSKYTWNEKTGELVLHQDDAAMLINNIVCEFSVKFTHNVHSLADTCQQTKTFKVVFTQPKNN